MAEPTAGEFFKAKAILEEDLVAAVEAYMDNPLKGAHRLASGYTLDLAAAVHASPFAVGMLADPEIKDASKRSAVRTAILLARPVKR
ncbi:hypothetical protein [Methylobacterium iners]|uniref:Uncharacterized protein n=1 Tax=Methylobacterium iners TaxID=418707 RepID=A0ABQ4S697_9HYPH|nr:hypothetical protein [Methylobacterium iners]GJD97338.1 hypothetical protein OCOJLMKI_4567 [Methylobacterium iners]